MRHHPICMEQNARHLHLVYWAVLCQVCTLHCNCAFNILPERCAVLSTDGVKAKRVNDKQPVVNTAPCLVHTCTLHRSIHARKHASFACSSATRARSADGVLVLHVAAAHVHILQDGLHRAPDGGLVDGHTGLRLHRRGQLLEAHARRLACTQQLWDKLRDCAEDGPVRCMCFFTATLQRPQHVQQMTSTMLMGLLRTDPAGRC